MVIIIVLRWNYNEKFLTSSISSLFCYEPRVLPFFSDRSPFNRYDAPETRKDQTRATQCYYRTVAVLSLGLISLVQNRVLCWTRPLDSLSLWYFIFYIGAWILVRVEKSHYSNMRVHIFYGVNVFLCSRGSPQPCTSFFFVQPCTRTISPPISSYPIFINI